MTMEASEDQALLSVQHKKLKMEDEDEDVVVYTTSSPSKRGAVVLPDEETPSATSNRHYHNQKVSSLDFERIVNQYSIQAVRDEWRLPPLPVDGNANVRQRFTNSNNNNNNTTIELRDDNNNTTTRTTEDGGHNHNNDDNATNNNNNNNNNNNSGKHPRRRRKSRHLLGYTGQTAARWFLSAWVGLLTGLTSNLIVQMSRTVVTWRRQNLQALIIDPTYSDVTVFTVFLTLNVAQAVIASWLCVGWVPEATGSGISRVKAYLNGIRDESNYVASIPVFVVKIVGTILSVASGLAVGQEGPLIHIGAIMGSGCSRISHVTSQVLYGLIEKTQQQPQQPQQGWRQRRRHDWRFLKQFLHWTTTELNQFATHAERRDLVSIGASCGFAASFGAPIGGLLFMLDDISTYFSRSLLLRILFANMIGTFCLAVQHGDLSNYSVINLGEGEGGYKLFTDSIFVNRVEELPLILLMGIGGGILGGLFCRTTMFLRRTITKWYPRTGIEKWQLLEVAVVSIVTSVLIFYLPTQKWACKEHEEDVDLQQQYTAEVLNYRDAASLIPNFNHESRNRFFCPPGEVNEMANMLFGSRIEAIKHILTDPAQFKQETLLTIGILFYGLMTLTFGIAIPSGIFTPTVLIGASLGGAIGVCFEQVVDPALTPSTFALLGVAALLAGIQRSTVSVAVILVEGTGAIKVLMPAIIVVVTARYVASLIYKKGIFDAVIELRKLPYLSHEENKRRYDAIEVGEIMSDPPVESIGPIETAKRLVELLHMSAQNGFPVIDPKSNKFLGLIRRDQIAALIECGVFNDSPRWSRPKSGIDETPMMRWAYHINDDRYDYIQQSSDRTDGPELIARAPRHSLRGSPNLEVAVYSALPTEFAKVSKDETGLVYISWLNPDNENDFVNIGAAMNRGAYIVTEFCPVSKAYNLFTSMGLRHIIVLGGDSGGEVVGVVVRANLLPEAIMEKTGI